jgi:hypothetical protein
LEAGIGQTWLEKHHLSQLGDPRQK